jgi:hypothetical protein
VKPQSGFVAPQLPESLTHPDLRAVAASGFRLMTADSENMNDGIKSRSRTSQVARA